MLHPGSKQPKFILTKGLEMFEDLHLGEKDTPTHALTSLARLDAQHLSKSSLGGAQTSGFLEQQLQLYARLALNCSFFVMQNSFFSRTLEILK